MAPNDLTPCRMAFYFVSTFAIAQTPTKQPALRLSRTKNLHFAKAPFPGFSAEELKTKENRPKHVFYACVLIGGFIYFVSTKDFSQVDYTPRNITTNTRGISTSNLPSKRKSAGRGKDISSAYRGLEVDDPDFDVGRYCLRKEKSGVMTFEECLGMAALKLTAGR